MIFRNAPKLTGGSDLKRYLQSDVFNWMRQLVFGLLNLDLTENFQAFRVDDIVFAPNATVGIPNQLSTVPSSRLIVRQTGNGLLTDGTWNLQFLQMVNNSANVVTASFIFYV